LAQEKAAIASRGCGLNLVESSRSCLTRLARKRRSRSPGKPEAAKRLGKQGKSIHKEKRNLRPANL
jgi:hypothetical protein